MTIDERIERLTERHEAMAQAAELIGHQIEALYRNSLTLHDSIKSLEHIAEIHERRISQIEGQ